MLNVIKQKYVILVNFKISLGRIRGLIPTSTMISFMGQSGGVLSSCTFNHPVLLCYWKHMEENNSAYSSVSSIIHK